MTQPISLPNAVALFQLRDIEEVDAPDPDYSAIEYARYFIPGGRSEAALNQAAREVLLAQASDWAFIMRTGTMVPYAERRTKSHLMRFNKIRDDVLAGQIDAGWLTKVEAMDNIFPNINYRVYRPI